MFNLSDLNYKCDICELFIVNAVWGGVRCVGSVHCVRFPTCPLCHVTLLSTVLDVTRVVSLF